MSVKVIMFLSSFKALKDAMYMLLLLMVKSEVIIGVAEIPAQVQ